MVLTISLIIVVGVIALMYIQLRKLKETAETTFSKMDVYLRKRWDMIPDLLETVKSYVEFEKETIEDIIRLRTEKYTNLTLDEKISINLTVETYIARLLEATEIYPTLLSNEFFISISEEFKKINGEIKKGRDYYNKIVSKYNKMIESIPYSFIANMFSLLPKKEFKEAAAIA